MKSDNIAQGLQNELSVASLLCWTGPASGRRNCTVWFRVGRQLCQHAVCCRRGGT